VGRVSDFDADLVRLLAEARASEAARKRSRERNLRAAALTDASLAGVLLDLAEHGARVTVRTVFGRALSGNVTVVAQDGIVLDSTMGRSYVRLDGIAWFRGATPRPLTEPAGDRHPPRAVTLAALLADLAPEHPRVAAAVTGERVLLSGELRAVGADVITIAATDGPMHLAARHVSELTVLASG